MICQVSDWRRRGLRTSVAARCRASGCKLYSGESEAPERSMEGRHERVRKRQVFLATFCDFLGFFGRQHGVGCRLRLPRHTARAFGLPDTACGAQLAAGVAATPQ